MNEKEPDFQWDFFDQFEEKLSKKALLHQLGEAFLWNPDYVQKYYTRDDALILSVYNKIHKDRQYESEWKAPYRVMPDFQNWSTEFDEDEHLSPVPLFDIDDQKIGIIKDKTQTLTPNDGSVIRLKHYEIAGLKSFDLQVIKPNLVFGMKPEIKTTPSSLWMRFDEHTRMTVERLPYQHWAPETHTEEYQIDPINTIQGSTGTLVYDSGHIIRMLPNGDILQALSKHHLKSSKLEPTDELY